MKLINFLEFEPLKDIMEKMKMVSRDGNDRVVL